MLCFTPILFACMHCLCCLLVMDMSIFQGAVRALGYNDTVVIEKMRDIYRAAPNQKGDVNFSVLKKDVSKPANGLS